MQEFLQNSIETFMFSDEDAPYVKVETIVDALGLNWELEREQFKENDHWGYREEMVPVDGGGKELLGGLPAAKIFPYLQSVNVSLVKEELREPLFNFQQTALAMNQKIFLDSDLLRAARAKANPSPLEQKLIQAADSLDSQQRGG